jgi:ABC-type lipoprotein export system ATPase subunit
MTIRITKLTKVYGRGESAVVALNECELDIAANEICIVRGPNGSGKSTLISIVAGELEPTAGSISLTTDSGRAPVIATINQFHNLIDELTVAEHFDLLENSHNQDLVPAELMHMRCADLSRGQAQQVAIALSLTSDLDLLLADEPTGALGSEESKNLYEFIRVAAHKNNIAVLLVTHDVNADRIADRIVRLRDGRMSESWTFGGSEKQVINTSGWVRLPEEVADGMTSLVDISASPEGASIQGRERLPIVAPIEAVLRIPGETPVIVARDLETRYGTHIVSREVSFEAIENEIVCVVGKSGAGKTTLLRTLSGLHHDFHGQISRQTVLPYFSADTLFGLGLRIGEFGIAQELIEKLALGELLERTLATLSGGQQQRALVAMALSTDHPIILLDEPTSALDDAKTAEVIRALLESNKTIVAATHDERLIAVANRVFKL